jgi:hypothetical protein
MSSNSDRRTSAGDSSPTAAPPARNDKSRDSTHAATGWQWRHGR